MDASLVLLSILIASFAIVALIVIPAFMLAFRNRALTHAERIKALEMGQDVPDDTPAARASAMMKALTPTEDVSAGALAHKCYSTATWAALAGFGSMASLGKSFSPLVACAIAASVGAIGVTAVICGTVLGARSSTSPSHARVEKFPSDAEAYDIAR